MVAMIAELLKRERMPHTTLRHPPAYTAQEKAAVSHTIGISPSLPSRSLERSAWLRFRSAGVLHPRPSRGRRETGVALDA